MNPTHLSANFYFNDVPSLRSAVLREEEVAVYSRGANPTIEEFNLELALLENKEACLSFSTGMGAVSALLLTYLKAGDHLIFHEHIYSWAKKLIQNRLPNWGIEITMLHESDLPQIEKHFKPNTKMIYLENPTFFTFEEIPLKSILEKAKEKNILTAMDNTYLGPANLKKELIDQIDFIIHSTTKIISGHSDVMGGAICTTKHHRKEIFEHGLMTLGAVMTPMNAMLSLRGLKSYHARTSWVKNEVLELVAQLRKHPEIEKVNFPWNNSEHPDYHFPVGLLSIVLKNKDATFVENFCRKLKVFKMAVSYGGIEAYLLPSIAFSKGGVDKSYNNGVMRLATGLQPASLLLADFNQALN
jgi:cystathionine beta-lyase/cystathionine gamma-synthase